MYYYLFYKLYKFSEAAPSRWLSDWKAGLAIAALEIWLLSSIGIYYIVATKKITELTIEMPIVFIPALLILGGNYFLFFSTDRWKRYAQEFDRWPKAQNKFGSWVVIGLIVAIIANFIFSIYLLYQVDWSQYR